MAYETREIVISVKDRASAILGRINLREIRKAAAKRAAERPSFEEILRRVLRREP